MPKSMVCRLDPLSIALFSNSYSMPALVSIQCNPVMMAFYNRLKEKGKNGKVIVCAIMRKLVHIIFGILKSGKKFDPNYKPILAWQEQYLQLCSWVKTNQARIIGWNMQRKKPKGVTIKLWIKEKKRKTKQWKWLDWKQVLNNFLSSKHALC